MERWVPAHNWHGYYEVSDLGNVRSIKRKCQRRYENREYGGGPVAHVMTAVGYPAVNLTKPGIRKQVYVHRLVLLSFLGLPKDGSQACHNNGNREDCRLINLRWDTVAANHADKIAHGTHWRGSNHRLAKLNESDVALIRNSPSSHDEMAALYGVSASTIKGIRTRKSWKHV